MLRLILVPLACVALYSCDNKTRVPLDGAADAGDVEPDIAPDSAATPDMGDAALDTAPADASDVADVDALAAPEDTDADRDAPELPDSDVEADEGSPPVCIASCWIEGSDQAPSTDLAAIPMHMISCSAEASYDPDGDELTFDWSVLERPDGSSTALDSTDLPSFLLYLDVAGRWLISMTATDATGRACTEPALIHVLATPVSDVAVELTWHTPGDPDETDNGYGVGSDLDLHLLHPSGCWEDERWDCHFRASNPNWGHPDRRDDDPSMDIDDSDGAGPELVTLNNPESGVRYRVGVHYWNDHGFGPSTAIVRVYLDGVLAWQWDRELEADEFWDVASINWGDRDVTLVNTVTDSVPTCE